MLLGPKGLAAWERSQGNDRARDVGAGSGAIEGNFVRVGDGLGNAVATAQGVTGVGGHSARGASTPPHALQVLCIATRSAYASWDRQFAAEYHMQLHMQVHGLTDVGVVATQGIGAGVDPLGGAQRDRRAQARHKQRDCMCTARDIVNRSATSLLYSSHVAVAVQRRRPCLLTAHLVACTRHGMSLAL